MYRISKDFVGSMRLTDVTIKWMSSRNPLQVILYEGLKYTTNYQLLYYTYISISLY